MDMITIEFVYFSIIKKKLLFNKILDTMTELINQDLRNILKLFLNSITFLKSHN